MRSVYILLLLCLHVTVLAGCARIAAKAIIHTVDDPEPIKPPLEWAETVKLSNGSTIVILRTRYYTEPPELPIYDYINKPRNTESIEFTNPISGRHVRWSGDAYTRPLLVDIVDDVEYIMVHLPGKNYILNKYKCPLVPIVLLRYNEIKSDWMLVDKRSYPEKYIEGNLSIDRDPNKYRYEDIPNNYRSWKYEDKKYFKRKHFDTSCGNPIDKELGQKHTQELGSPSIEVALDVIKRQDFNPARITKTSVANTTEYKALEHDKNRVGRCTHMIESSQHEGALFVYFTKDDTDTKVVMPRGRVICDQDAIWFVDHASKNRIVTIRKYTPDGVFLYKLYFDKPAPIAWDTPVAKYFIGHIVYSSFRVKEGYLYFDWWDTQREWRRKLIQKGINGYIRRIMTVRVKEPLHDSREKAEIKGRVAHNGLAP